jgi:hypothetical protein
MFPLSLHAAKFGCEVKALGRGRIQRIKNEVKGSPGVWSAVPPIVF